VLADFLRAHIERHAQDWGRTVTAAG